MDTIKNITPTSSMIILFIAAAMGLGLGYEHPSIIFTLPDLLCLASLFLIIRSGIIKEFSFIAVSFFLSLLTILLVNENYDFHPFLSLIYFYKPYLAFLLGYAILNSRKNLEYFFFNYLFFSFFLLILIFYRVIAKPYSADLSYFFYNISIVGANGRNAYLVMVALSAMIGMILLISSTNKKYQLFAGIYTIIASLLVCIALSRQAIVALFIFYLLLGLNVLFRGNKHQKLLLIGTLLIYALLLFVTVFFFQKVLAGYWETKITRDVQAITTLDINKFSADRLTIYYALLKDILQSPFVGIAFKSLPSYLSEIPSQLGPHTQLSPHSQYLGAYWKMGLLPFVFYLYFLGALYFCIWKLNQVQQDMFYYGILALMSVMLFVLAFFQDVLLFPISGVLFSLICGGCVAMLKNILSKTN